jgi:hypothetical protein
MTQKEILKQGYWINIFTMSNHNNFGYEINKRLKKSWRTELTKSGISDPFKARQEANRELKFILNNNG